MVDGLSYVMTIVFIIYNYQLVKNDKINLIIMGSSSKGFNS